jgi:uncharacterized FAD-dependent dehydrogenase
MPLRVSNIRLPADQAEATLGDHIARRLKVAPGDILHHRILRKSLDLRDKGNVSFVYTVEVALPPDRIGLVGDSDVRVEQYEATAFHVPPPGDGQLAHRPIVIGTGPAGLVAGWLLALAGYRPLLIERGRSVRDRIRDVSAFDCGGPLDPESNYLFGEGGAGTFSDGKLTCRSSGPDVQRVLALLAECKGKPSIVYDHRPHLGSNRLPAVVKALRRRIEAAGGEIRFSCRMEDIDIADGQLRGIGTSSGYVPTSVAILAIGHSARDTYLALRQRGVPFVPKPFQLGVRIEQPQDSVNRFQYGARPWERVLGAADYSVIARGRNDLFSFCMCAGGQIIPSVSAAGFFGTNGMSLSGRDSVFANSGLMITVTPEMFEGSDTFGGIHLQERYEKRAFEMGRGEYLCPIQTADDYLENRQTKSLPPCSYRRGLVSASIAETIPTIVASTLSRALPLIDRRWSGRFLREAVLVGPESRGSAPVRIPRHPVTRVADGVRGLYPAGEGAGYAGGIISAAVDGLRAAKAIIAAYQPLERSCQLSVLGSQSSIQNKSKAVEG